MIHYCTIIEADKIGETKMTKQEMINEILKMRIPRSLILLTFHNEDNSIYFQYFGVQKLNEFVDWNFEEFAIKEVLKIERSKINSNCVVITF